MTITKGTIVRTILLVIVLINIILKNTGNPIIQVDEGTVGSLVETIVEIICIAVAWWKNNSFTQNAIKADEFMRKLNDTELKK
ncbi:phage holin [Lachnospiraceae bacterium KM106-2]|nr:phage holin [Lachnospiraceae bacterium KM106-2]